MSRFAPGILLVVVSAACFRYSSSRWSWLAGPVAALVVWGIAQKAREPAAPSPAREPAPVD